MKRTPGKSIEAREKYWLKIIEAARRYPAGITAYCRFMDISKNNYYFWFKRLRPNHPEWHDLTNHPEILLPVQQKKPSDDPKAPIETEVLLNRRRRKWSLADRARILEETDNADPGELGAILRREGLYVHTLNKWRTARDLLEIAVQKKQRTPQSNVPSAEFKKLKEENLRLVKQLRQATDIIGLQKKISDLLSELNLRTE